MYEFLKNLILDVIHAIWRTLACRSEQYKNLEYHAILCHRGVKKYNIPKNEIKRRINVIEIIA